MVEYKFRYETQEQLKAVFRLLTVNSVRVSLYLRANLSPEFLNAWNNVDVVHGRETQRVSFPKTWEPKPLDQNGVKAVKQAVKDYEEIARKNKVHPFVICRFDDIYHWKPQIEPTSPVHQVSLYDFIEGPKLDALSFLGSEAWRFMYLSFTDIKDPKQIDSMKLFVGSEVPERYVIGSFNAGLNPRSYTSDHYYDYEEVDGELWVSKGVITISYKHAPKPSGDPADLSTLGVEGRVLKMLGLESLDLKLLTEQVRDLRT